MLWYKHHGSLNQSIVLTSYSIVVCRTAVLNKLKAQIDRAPDIVTARHIYQQAQAVEDTTFTYLMAASDLDVMMKHSEVAKDELPQKVGHNNPEEAAWFIKDITDLTNTFMEDIQGYNHYKAQVVYKQYIFNFHKKLVELDSTYFKNANTETVLDTILTNCANCM